MPNPVQQLSIGRIVIGALAWLSPALAAKAFGIGVADEGYLPSRLFGARDLALGVGTLTATGESRKKLLQVGLACDALDLAAAVVGHREGKLPTAGAVLTGLAAAGAVATAVKELSAS